MWLWTSRRISNTGHSLRWPHALWPALLCVFLCLTSWAHAAGCHPQTIALPLTLDDEQLDLLDTTLCDESGSVPMAALLNILQPQMSASAFAALKGPLKSKSVWLLGDTHQGVTLAYNQASVTLTLTLPPAQRRASRLNLRENTDTAAAGHVVTPHGLSAFSNFYAARSYSQGTGMAQGWAPLRLDTDSAVNLNGNVVEGSLNYVEDADHPIMADNVRMVRDDPARMLRYQAGELSYPLSGFQTYQQLLGVGVARNFSLQPYRVSAPAGRSNFTLLTPSMVEIYINNQRVRTLQLGKGTYELRDFPIVNGVNNVRLRITDAYGRIEEKVFPVVNDADLLEGGLSEFAVTAGLPVRKNNRSKSYDTTAPMALGLFRYGLTDTLTTGLNVQTDETVQLFGLEQTFASPWGIVRAEAATSHQQATQNDAWANAWRLEYRNVLQQNTSGLGTGNSLWSLSIEHQSQAFNTVSSTAATPYSYQAQAAYSRNLTPELTGSLGLGHRIGRGTTLNETSPFAGLYWRAAQDLALNVNTSYSQLEKFNIFVSLSWFPFSKPYQLTSSYDAQNHTVRIDGTRAQTNLAEGWELTGGVAASDDTGQGTGSATYTGGRGFARLSHDIITGGGWQGMSTDTGTQSHVQLGTALVYADGQAAMSRPVQSSFLILSPRASVEQDQLGLNPVRTGTDDLAFAARSGLLGPAVLTDMMPYLDQRLEAGVLAHTDDDALLGQNIFTVHPTYKSGINLKVGSDALAYVVGQLNDEHGQPVILEGGQLVASPSAAALPSTLIFTNRQGIFITEALAPGRYQVHLSNHPGKVATFTVTAGQRGRVNVGALELVTASIPQGSAT